MSRIIIRSETVHHQGPREEQQDQLLVRNTRNGHLFVVIDGMGGTVGGRQAAIQLREIFGRLLPKTPLGLEALGETMHQVNVEFLQWAAREFGDQDLDPGKAPGAVATVLRLARNKGEVAHLGDTRLYVWSGHDVVQQTTDQVDQNGNPTQCFGNEHIEPELTAFVLSKDTRLFLCSDGIYRAFDEPRSFVTHALSKLSLEQIKEELEQHHSSKFPDNATVIIAEIEIQQREAERFDAPESTKDSKWMIYVGLMLLAIVIFLVGYNVGHTAAQDSANGRPAAPGVQLEFRDGKTGEADP